MVTVSYVTRTGATPYDVYQCETMDVAEMYVISANKWRSHCEVIRGGLYYIASKESEVYTQLTLAHVNHGYAVDYVPSATVYACEVNGHFPCDSATCEYCDAVRGLMYVQVSQYDYRFVDGLDPVYYYNKTWSYGNNHTRYMWVRSHRKIGTESGDILSFEAYTALGHDYSIDSDNMMWSTCDGCNKLVCRQQTCDNYGYCSESCRSDNEVFYCIRCGDIKVDNDGDVCNDCDYTCAACGVDISRSEHRNYDGYCRSCYDDNNDSDQHDNATGYDMGEVIPESSYSSVDSCWINPSGEVICVPYCNHYATAQKMGFSGTDAAERAGYIHVSTYWNVNRRFVHIPDRPSIAQYTTMWSLCDALGHSYPTELQTWIDRNTVIEVPEYVPMTYNVIQSVLPRKLREVFYPLSGD